MFRCVIYQVVQVGWFLLHPRMPCYSSTLSLDFVNKAPCAFIMKTKTTNHKGWRRHFRRLTFQPRVWVLMGGSVLEA